MAWQSRNPPVRWVSRTERQSSSASSSSGGDGGVARAVDEKVAAAEMVDDLVDGLLNRSARGGIEVHRQGPAATLLDLVA